jgi:hypothetical protein
MQDLHAVTLGATSLVDPMQILHGCTGDTHGLHRRDPLAHAAGQDMQILHATPGDARRRWSASETGL